MSLLTPTLLQKLGRSRFNVKQAVASTGVGERRSRAKGLGLEFADHRPYQPGDDIRHLDRHVHARLGEHHVKQFSVYQQLSVTIMLDASASMRCGQPQKFMFGMALAAGLAYVGLAGGDQVLLGTFADRTLSWHPKAHGVRRIGSVIRWLERQEPRGITDLAGAMRVVATRLPPKGFTIIISDWMADGADEALKIIASRSQELVVIQLLSQEEIEPERLGNGEVRMIDVESGQEVEVSLDDILHQKYRAELEWWSRELKNHVHALQGRYFRVQSGSDLEGLLLRDWRVQGLFT